MNNYIIDPPRACFETETMIQFSKRQTARGHDKTATRKGSKVLPKTKCRGSSVTIAFIPNFKFLTGEYDFISIHET